MVPDFVDQHMGDDVLERFVMGLPIGQNRPAIEEDHLRQRRDIQHALPSQIDAVIEP